MQLGLDSGKDRDGFKSCKIEAVKAAKDFRYGKEVIEQLEKAETEGEISRIMITVRHNMFGD